jgi:hypothetical protein
VVFFLCVGAGPAAAAVGGVREQAVIRCEIHCDLLTASSHGSSHCSRTQESVSTLLSGLFPERESYTYFMDKLLILPLQSEVSTTSSLLVVDCRPSEMYID